METINATISTGGPAVCVLSLCAERRTLLLGVLAPLMALLARALLRLVGGGDAAGGARGRPPALVTRGTGQPSSMAWKPSSFDSGAAPVGGSMEGHVVADKGPKQVLLSCLISEILEVDLVRSVWVPILTFTLDWVDDGALTPAGDGIKVEEDELWRPYMAFENSCVKFARTKRSFDRANLRAD